MHGVPIERYFVTTDDGYILGLYHLPRSLNSSGNSPVSAKPIFFMHGQVSSSQDFVAYRNSSAYYFWDRGFDVWLGKFFPFRFTVSDFFNFKVSFTFVIIFAVVVVVGNARGNTFSRNHTTLNPDDGGDFWQFR